MRKRLAAFLAIVVVIVCTLAGAFGGAVIGDTITPSRFDFTGVSGPSVAMGIGFLVGLIAGFAFGAWAAMTLVNEAKRDRAAAASPPLPDPPPSRDPSP